MKRTKATEQSFNGLCEFAAFCCSLLSLSQRAQDGIKQASISPV
ncbi:hypothetical protein NC99_42710 [Sunxiuqinia dokdonensis]|uniref:Uncharacterized protein n=1 Tax=Sunxiuqinia dokdonensis TaxID=1409788 RepID=A0A0L8V3C1_9BACT|nr:hypothetical protein NC99_42710 [Sunxiuqinia dokdonensis]